MNDKLSTSAKVMNRRIVKTDDGSTSVEIPDMNEMYHSRKGAIKESKYVYIEHGFNLCSGSPIRVLEIGMGTGLNVLLTYMTSEQNQCQVNYHTLEPYPLNEEEWLQLNYNDYLDIPANLLSRIHSVNDRQSVSLSDQFDFKVSHNKLEAIDLEISNYDVIYFDAFAPNKQENPWQMGNIQKLFSCLKPGGLLSTYCSQGQFKRNLTEVGFNVTNPEGPMGKREITVAYKPV